MIVILISIRSAGTREYRWLMLSSWLGTDRFGGKSQRRDATADRFAWWWWWWWILITIIVIYLIYTAPWWNSVVLQNSSFNDNDIDNNNDNGHNFRVTASSSNSSSVLKHLMCSTVGWNKWCLLCRMAVATLVCDWESKQTAQGLVATSTSCRQCCSVCWGMLFLLFFLFDHDWWCCHGVIVTVLLSVLSLYYVDTQFLANHTPCSMAFGDRSFVAVGPRVWISLPAHLQDEDISYNSFTYELKMYWF